ncbi:hypothetical protein TD95_000532 [Thielaviopsis punctulata]|uniref:Mediator of RNA polymerase II transcription subunit 9 n=1 Tax=Thielaviopsis punctulata TaxID=72032 RepID=A0A0F4ZA20_9PEZI|nr:hypothetical protein TD95_000532 [Thielaviopsis punctulata]
MKSTESNQQQHPMAMSAAISPDSLDVLTELTLTLDRLRASLQILPGTANATLPNGQQPLLLKDLPTATDPIKHKLQKARVQVKALSDMNRTIADQEEEIADLEKRILLQQEVLEKLKASGTDFVTETQQRDS